uniref:GM08734p n=1 Tax=Drosophila melanogaster TaxID=7227 RepID=Q95S53_DROME|nr:GM08734p [Drosophila melanogaster]
MDMVRQSLLQEGTNPNAVIANERSTPDELGIAMLRLNKLMHGLVDKFVETLKLSTTDKEAKWREEILETSKRRAKIERTEERKRKRKELKEQKAQTKNRLEWLEQNKVVDADVNGATAETPTLQVSKVNDQEIPQSFAKTENSPVLKVKKEKTPKTPAKKERNLQKKQAFDEQINPEITKLSSKKQNLNTIKENNAEPQLEGRPKNLSQNPSRKNQPESRSLSHD